MPAVRRNHAELFYADVPTFGKAPLREPDDLEDVDVAAYGIPWDLTASPRSGARLGPRRIREETVALHPVWDAGQAPMVSIGVDDRRSRRGLTLVDCGDAMIFPYDVERTRASIHRLSSDLARETFPIALGGDHYVMYPAYQGVRDAHPDAKVGIVQIDAHDDTILDDPVLGAHWCGTPVQRAIEYGELDPRAVAMVGLRNFLGLDQLRRHRADGFVVITMDEVRQLGPRAVADKAIGLVRRHCDLVYLTVDIDAADPSCAPGSASLSPGGFHSHELMSLMRELGEHEEIIALDLVEVAPELDPTGQTAVLAAYALFHFIQSRFLLS